LTRFSKVEEIPHPEIYAPRAIVASIFIGAASAFIFLISLLFSISDIDVVISSPAGALLTVGAIYIIYSFLSGKETHIDIIRLFIRPLIIRRALPVFRSSVSGARRLLAQVLSQRLLV
jgi:hypothetical protein